MLVKKMVASKKINISTQKLFSFQLKKALFYAFLEAKKHGNIIIDSQILLFGLLKVDNTIASQLLQQLYKSRSSYFNPTQKLLSKLKLNFRIANKSVAFPTDDPYPNFSRPVKRLLFFLLKSSKKRQPSVITSLHVLNYLLRHKSIVKLVKETLITN